MIIVALLSLGSLQGRSESPDVKNMMRMKLIMIMIMRLAMKVVLAVRMMSGQECKSQTKFSTWRESLGGAARAGDIGPGNKTGC